MVTAAPMSSPVCPEVVEPCATALAAPVGSGRLLAETATGDARSWVSVMGPVTVKGAVSLLSMLARDALPAV